MTPGEWFVQWWPIWSPIVLLLLTASATGVWTIINRRDGEKTARRRPMPPTWPEMWSRLDELEKRLEDSEKRETTAYRQAADARDEAQEVKRIIARWFVQLKTWDRAGPIPMPAAEDLRRLEIDPEEGDLP